MSETFELLAELERLAGDKTAEGLRIAIAGVKNGISAAELDEAVHLRGAAKWRGFDVDALRTVMDRDLRERFDVSVFETGTTAE